MKLNSVERLLMNNPVRAALQRRVEASHFERLGGKLRGSRVLEIGCGRGVGIEVLLGRFEAACVHAFDIDAATVRIARDRVARKHAHHRFFLFAGDAVAIPAADESYDAVVDTGALHHVPDWRSAVDEVRRVLRPAGRFYFLEVSRRFLESWSVRTFLDHPRDDRFTSAEFVSELERCGILVENRLVHRVRGYFFAGVGFTRPRVDAPACADQQRRAGADSA